VPTMAFLEFLLSGFESASKRRAPASPAFCRGVGPPNLLCLFVGPIYAHAVLVGPVCALGVPMGPELSPAVGASAGQATRSHGALAGPERESY
jgi:hypothetical protein